jgi:hypothetical protein
MWRGYGSGVGEGGPGRRAKVAPGRPTMVGESRGHLGMGKDAIVAGIGPQLGRGRYLEYARR